MADRVGDWVVTDTQYLRHTYTTSSLSRSEVGCTLTLELGGESRSFAGFGNAPYVAHNNALMHAIQALCPGAPE